MTIDPWPTFKDIVKAYKSCRLHKPANRSQTQFEMRLGENLLKLHQEIHAGRYKPKPAKVFIVTDPKPREIFAADFRDRVVHHLVVSQLEPKWERKFLYASFACRKGKGVHGAVKYFQNKVRSLSHGGLIPVYALQVDLQSFFITINRETLVSLLTSQESNPMLISLIQIIYLHNARKGSIFVGKKELVHSLAAGKSWFDQPEDLGLPIGNLTSQFGANVYLNGLDHFVARVLKPDAYFRYMDDLTLLSNDPEILRKMVEPIDSWLSKHRGQKLNPSKTILTNLKDGVNYLGYRMRQSGPPSNPLELFIEPKKKWKFIQALKDLEALGPKIFYYPHRLGPKLTTQETQRLLASINSRIGLMIHASSFLIRKNSLHKTFRELRNWYHYQIKKGYRALRIKKKRKKR